jgi:hypothetical protein
LNDSTCWIDHVSPSKNTCFSSPRPPAVNQFFTLLYLFGAICKKPQNALIASALARNHRFCLITSKDGKIVYANPQFKSLFPNRGNGASVQDWLEAGSVPVDTRSGIVQAMAAGGEGQITLTIEGAWKQKLSLLLALEPIDRSAEFVLLRGREESRAERR